MLDAHFLLLYLCQSLYTLQCGLAAIAGLVQVVIPISISINYYNIALHLRLGILSDHFQIPIYTLCCCAGMKEIEQDATVQGESCHSYCQSLQQ